MEYYAYGNTEVIKRIFSTIVMMTGANSSFDSLIAMATLLIFTVMLGKTAFSLDFSPLARWFLGSMVVWYVMVMPKVDVKIIDQTNPTSITAISNVPLGPAFVGNVTSSIGKWFVDKAEVVFTPINDINYSRSGMVFGANAYNEMRRADISRYVPQIQTDFSQYLANCTTYDIRLYNKFTQDAILNSDDIWSLIKNTNSVLPTPVWNRNTNQIETKFCNEAAVLMEQNITATLGNPKLLQAFTVRLDPAGNKGATIDQTRVMSALEAAYSNIFEGIRKPALKIIQQEMMVNAVKIADIQNAAIDGSPEQMQAALAAAQAQAQVHTQNTSAWIMASKYLPIAHNVIEAVLLALAPLVIVMMIMGGLSMAHVALGYFATIMWVKLWPGMFAVVNGIANMYQANHSFGVAYGAKGTTLANSMDVLSVATDTQAFAGFLIMLVPLISWGLIKLGSMGLQAAFSGVSAPGGRATESSSASIGAGNINIGNSNYDNANAHKNDRSSWYRDPGVNQTSTYMGTQTSGPMGGQYFKNDLPISVDSSMSKGLEHSRNASIATESANSMEARASESVSTALGQTMQYLSQSGSGLKNTISNSSSLSAQTREGLQYADKMAEQIANETGAQSSNSTKSAISGVIGLGLSGLKLDGKANMEAALSEEQYTKAKEAATAGREKGYSIGSDVVSAVQQSDQYQKDLSSGNQLAQGINSSMTSARSASFDASESRRVAAREEQSARESYRQATEAKGQMPINEQTVPGISSANLLTPEGVNKALQDAGSRMGVDSAPASLQNIQSSTSEMNQRAADGGVREFYENRAQAVKSGHQSGDGRVLNEASDNGLFPAQIQNLQKGFDSKAQANTATIGGVRADVNRGHSQVIDGQNQVSDQTTQMPRQYITNPANVGNLIGQEGGATQVDAKKDPQQAEDSLLATEPKPIRRLNKRR